LSGRIWLLQAALNDGYGFWPVVNMPFFGRVAWDGDRVDQGHSGLLGLLVTRFG
jgi:hypothetical protein